MKKRLNSSILAATSLTAVTSQHLTEANPIVFTEGQLSSLSLQNQLESSDATILDFSNMTPDIVSTLRLVPIDLSKFQNVRNIILPWYAANLNITLPENFRTPKDDSYSRLTIVQASKALTKDSDLVLNVETLLSGTGKVIVDTKAIPITELRAGVSVAKIERNVATVNITVPDTLESIDTDGVIPSDIETSVTLLPTAAASGQNKPPFPGIPTAVLAANPWSLDISAYMVNGKDVTVSGVTNLKKLVVSSGDCIGSLKVTGETPVTTNAARINKVEFTSVKPNQAVITAMSATATVSAPTAREAHIASFVGKTELDFSKLDLGSTDATATRIKDIFDNAVPIASIVSIKINSDVLAAVMTKLSFTNLSSFSALKRLDVISATGGYQTTTLTSADLPASIEEFYSSNLAIRKGTLSADLQFDTKFSATTLDLSGLNLNGHTFTIAGSFNPSVINTLKLSSSLLGISATKNLISASAGKSIIVSGTVSGALTTSNLQNVGIIDLRAVSGATSFSAPLNVDGNNSNLSNLYLPAAFDVSATNILSGVDNGEVTVYLSGAYSGAKTVDASYDKTILNFTNVTGTGRFQLPAGVRGLILSTAVKGIQVASPAVDNEFDFSGLTYLRQLTDLPTSATVLKLNNSLASTPLNLNLIALTSLTTLQLNSSRISQLSLPASAALTDGGGNAHLNLLNVTDLAVLNGLNALLATRSINQVSFPNNPDPRLHINLVDTIPGLKLNNLDKISELTVDKDYAPGMWPTVKNKSLSVDWSNFFNYIVAPVIQGGINSPSIFDLSGQIIENQTQADAFVAALNELSQPSKSVIQKIIIRLGAATSGTIDLSGIVTTDFTHGSLKIIIDQSTGSAATVSVPAGWSAKTKTYVSLAQVAKTAAASWTNYLNYHFALLSDKGEAATSLDLSSLDLTAAQWSALMSALNTFSTPELIQTIRLKLVAANSYSSQPAFTTATFSAATSIIVDVTGVKNSGAQVIVTGLPSATAGLQVEQRVTSASSVDRATASSWKGYIEHLLSNISGTNYTLDLTAADVHIQTAAQLTELNTALAGLSTANKAKIQNIKLKIESGNRAADFTVSTDFTGFSNLASLVVDATGALNGTAQSTVTFGLTNAPTYAKAHVTSLASVDPNLSASWEYYLAYRLATDGVGLTNLDVSNSSFANQSELTAFLRALNNQSSGDKSSVQSIKLKLDSTYSNSSVDFSVDLGSGQVSGLDHVSFAVEVDRNGANSIAPVSFTFGTAITAANTTVKDTAFTGLGSFDGTNAHHWLGYVRALLSTIASGTTTLDLSTHSALEMNNAKLAKFIVGMNALPVADKAKIATLKIKLASGAFGVATADLSGLTEFSALTSLVVDRNGARASATLSDPAVSVSGPGSITTVNDPELRSVLPTDQTNQWLGYLRFVLNGMSGVANTVDLSAIAIDSTTAATAFNNALASLPTSEKLKVQTLKLSASASVTLGTSVSGFTNLTKVIVDQTAAPTAAIIIAGGFGTTQKTYVTSASTAQTSGAWAKYIDYAMSSVADGGLNQTAFDLSALTLDNSQVGQFLTALNASSSVANVTALTMKLAPVFCAGSLDLSGYTNLTGLGADSVVIYRNAAAHLGAPVTITYGSSFTDAHVQIIDPTAPNVDDTADAQQWLGYLTGLLNDAGSGITLDLSSVAIDDAEAVTAFNAAITCLDSALSSKVDILKLTVSHTADITLGTGAAGFSNLSRIEFTKPATNTVTFADALAGKRTYITNFNSVKMDTAADWTNYLNYMLSTTNGGQSASSLNLDSRAFANQTEVDAFFAGLNFLTIYGDKSALTTLRMKLADGLNAIVIGGSTTAATGLAAGLHVIVDPGTSTGTTHAGTNAGKVQADNLIVLSATPAFSKGHIAYLAEQGSFAGIVDLSGLEYISETDVVIELNLLSADIKAKIKTINLKLQSAFGSSTLTLGALNGFTGVTFNIDRNGAVDGANIYDSLVTVANNTGQTVNLTDAEFHNMSTFSNTSSANWIGYLTHELNSAPASYTLDLTVHPALMLDSENAVNAFNSALTALSSTLKTKVALLKIKSSTKDEISTNVTGFSNLAKVIVDCPATGVNMTLNAGFGNTPTLYAYITTPFNGMNAADWTKFFNYQLNAVNIGGLGATDIVLAQRLSSEDLTAVLAGLSAATNKVYLTTLTLNLASDVVGDFDVGAIGLTRLTTVTINTNGSVARLVPINSFVGKTTFSSISNVNPASQGSWRAYLKGQSSIAAIDIREVELADQAEVTAFLTALASESRKENVTSLKMKLNANYTGTVDFRGVALTGLTALTANNSVEVHRNSSTATAVQSSYITNAKIKVVDLTATSLTDRSSSESWRRYLTALIENVGFSGSIDLSIDSDTYLRTNAHVTAFMSGLQNLSPANKLAVTSLKLELASGATWSDITNLGQGLTGFNNLTSFILDATGAYTSAGGNPQVTVAFDYGLNVNPQNIAGKVIVSRLNSVDKDSQASWRYYFNSGAMTSVDVSSITLNNTEATAFLAALGTGVTTKAGITSLTMKLDPAFGVASLAINGFGFNTTATAFTVHRNGAVNGNPATPVAVSLTNRTGASSLSIVDPTITDADSVLKTSTSSWLAYLTYALSGVVTVLDLTDDNLVLGTAGQATALSRALDALDTNLKAKIQILKVKAATSVTINANLTHMFGFTGLLAVELDKPAANTITFSHVDLSTQLRIADLAKVNKSSANEWEFYLNHLTKDGPAALDLSGITLSYVELNALNSGLGMFSTAAGNGNKLSSLHIKVSGASGLSNYAITADLDAQPAINSADKFIVDVSGFTYTYNGSQATVSHTGGTPKAIQLQISSASDLYRNSSASWGMYLNYVKTANANTMPATVDLTGSSSLYLRSQADVDALMTAIQARSDKGNISTLNVRLAPGSVGSDITFGIGVNGINPTMNITATGATNNGTLITSSGIHYAGSFTSADKTVTQNFASAVVNKAVQADWTKYLTYVLSSTAEGGLGYSSIVVPALTTSGELTALMSALNGLSNPFNPLKAAIQHIHLDVSHANFNGALSLGTGLTGGLTNLQQVTYVRASAALDATGSGFFYGKLQRLRTNWNSDTLASTSSIGQYLQYILMDTEMGGLEQTLVDLTPLALTSAQAGYLNTALGALPDDLSFRITELRLNLNASSAVTFDAGGLRNLSTVKYFQTGVGELTWADVDNVGFRSATKTRFRNAVADVTDKTSQFQWAEYLLHKLAPVAEGGLGATALDLSAVDLGNVQVTGFWGGLLDSKLNDYRPNITSIKFSVDNVDNIVGDITLNGGGKTYNDNLKIIAVMNNAPDNSFTLGTGTSGFKNSSNADLPDSIIDYRITVVPVSGTATAWERWLNNQLSTTFGGAGVTSIDLSGTNTITSKAQLFNFFDGLQANAYKGTVKDIFIDARNIYSSDSSIPIGMDTTGLTALTSVVIQPGVGYTYSAAGDVAATNLAIINSATGTLGANGTGDQWQGYLAYLLEDAAHGGSYTGSNPIAINLTAAALQVNSLQVLIAIETAITTLPARLKARISAISIKTTNASVDYTGGASYTFGNSFTSDVLAELSNLKAVIIDASSTSNKPAFSGVGAFYNASAISKIVY